MYQRTQMKQEVKQIISGTRPRPMWIALLYLVIASIGATLIQGIFSAVAGTSFLTNQLVALISSGYDMEAAMEELILMYADQLVTLVGTIVSASFFSSILITLWQGLMNVGFNGYCLSLVRRENPAVGRIFCAFPMFGKVLLTTLLVWVFTTLWTLLFVLGLVIVVIIAALLMAAVPALGVILMILAYAAFLILMVWLQLRYAMTNYILLDTGKYGLEAITDSKRMMKGNKGKLFVLHLSFIGWYLLMYAIVLVGCIIIGIIAAVGVAAGGSSMGALAGMVGGVMFVLVVMMAAIWLFDIWLLPYVNGSVAKFYLFFKSQEPAAQEGWPTLGDTTTTNGDTTDTEY